MVNVAIILVVFIAVVWVMYKIWIRTEKDYVIITDGTRYFAFYRYFDQLGRWYIDWNGKRFPMIPEFYREHELIEMIQDSRKPLFLIKVSSKSFTMIKNNVLEIDE